MVKLIKQSKVEVVAETLQGCKSVLLDTMCFVMGPSDRNQIANFTYLDYNTNIDISDDPPAEYVDRYRQKLGEDGYKKTCAENALPVDFEKMSYPDFLEQRRKLMAGIVRKAYQKLCI